MPGYEGPAYNAAVEATHLVAAGDITPAQGASLDAILMSTWLSDATIVDPSALARDIDPSGAVTAALLDPFPHIEAALQLLTSLF